MPLKRHELAAFTITAPFPGTNSRCASIVLLPRHPSLPLVKSARPLFRHTTPQSTIAPPARTASPQRVGGAGEDDIPRVQLVPGHADWLYTGPDLSEGPRPAVVYLALAAKQSLQTDPFNQYVREVAKLSPQTRVFAPTLPMHSENLTENEHVFHQWRKVYAQGGDVISPFLRRTVATLTHIVNSGLVSEGQLHIAGLSRGGLLAGLLATDASFTLDVASVALFAPVTALSHLSELSELDGISPRAVQKIERASMQRPDVVQSLVPIPVNIYIGNVDTRVQTRFVVNFALQLATLAATSGIRAPPHSLVMYPRYVSRSRDEIIVYRVYSHPCL